MSHRIAVAETILGWMSSAELQWLEKQAVSCQRAIELGSFYGRSSVALSAAKELICVDHWILEPQEKNAMPISGNAVGQDIYPEFCRNVAAFPNIRAVVCNLRDDLDVAALCAELHHSAELVFIDAAHDEENVMRDITTALQLVKSGGIICGHDYSESWPGVIAGVTKLLPDAKPTGAGSIWAYQVSGA